MGRISTSAAYNSDPASSAEELRLPSVSGNNEDSHLSKANHFDSLNEARGLFAVPVKYINCPEFQSSDSSQLWNKEERDGAFQLIEKEQTVSNSMPRGVTTTVSTAEGVLSKEELTKLFRHLHYAKFQQARLQKEFENAALQELPESVLLHFKQLHEIALHHRNKILESNIPLVMSIAKKFVSPTITFDNLLAEGNLMLLAVVDQFNWQMGFCFSTFATRVLRNRFMNLHAKERAYRVHIKDSQGDAYPNEVADHHREHIHPLVRTRLRQSVESCLDGRERAVIELRFGLETGKEITLREIGEIFSLTRERVRQIESKALDKLFKTIDSDSELLDRVSDTLSSEWIALREQREQQNVESLSVALVQFLTHSRREAKLAQIMDWAESLPERDAATERILKALQFLDSNGWLVKTECDSGCIYSLAPAILAIAESHTPRISKTSSERLRKALYEGQNNGASGSW